MMLYTAMLLSFVQHVVQNITGRLLEGYFFFIYVLSNFFWESFAKRFVRTDSTNYHVFLTHGLRSLQAFRMFFLVYFFIILVYFLYFFLQVLARKKHELSQKIPYNLCNFFPAALSIWFPIHSSESSSKNSSRSSPENSFGGIPSNSEFLLDFFGKFRRIFLSIFFRKIAEKSSRCTCENSSRNFSKSSKNCS